MIAPTRAVQILWLAWLLGWMLAARSTAGTVARQSVKSRLAHSVFVWAGALLLFIQPQGSGFLFHPLLPAEPPVAWGGVALVALGLGFSAWARMHLGRLWSATVTLKENHAVVRTGPYGITRHPIYTGLLLALAGTALVRCTPAALIGLVLLVVGFGIKIRQEERLLLQHFGDAYQAYRAEVPALIPRP